MERFCELLGMYLAAVVACVPFAAIAWLADPSPVPAIALLVSGPLFVTAALAKADADGLLDD